jgi:hypothetical protein
VSAALIGDQRLNELNDLPLACGGGVEAAANLDKSPIYLGKPPVDVCAKVAKVLPKSIETGHGGLTKVADLGTDFRHVAVCGAGEHTGSGGVLLARSYSPIKLAHLGFQSGDACLEVLRLHELEPIADRRYRRTLIYGRGRV